MSDDDDFVTPIKRPKAEFKAAAQEAESSSARRKQHALSLLERASQQDLQEAWDKHKNNYTVDRHGYADKDEHLHCWRYSGKCGNHVKSNAFYLLLFILYRLYHGQLE
jgi:Flp pilus assembly protein TadB